MLQVIPTYRMKYKSGVPIVLIPIFDIHWGESACDESALKKMLKETNSKQTLYIGGGDWASSIITRDIKRYRKAGDTTKGDAIIDEQVDTLYDIFNPYREHIIGIGEGNHEDKIWIDCGTNPIKRLCEKLSTKTNIIPFLGISGLFRLMLRSDIDGDGRTLIIRYHHGWGGGSRTRGGSLTKYANDMGGYDADIYLYGHDHKLIYDCTPRLGVSPSGKLVSRAQHLLLCGTYLKTYSDKVDPTYSEKKGYLPTRIGSPIIEIIPWHSGSKNGTKVKVTT